MHLRDLLGRALPPEPWREGDNIPWNEPGFSERMLREHLSQDHDAASRRFATIDRHVEWIHTALLERRPTAVLDLACGPGLYAGRLAHLGHRILGIDFSPASIAYARASAEAAQLPCRYQLVDLRAADYGSGFGLAMLLYGELNVFPRQDAIRILRRAHGALDPGGLLLLEPHTYEAILQIGQSTPSWSISAGGLFAETPYLSLVEHFWDRHDSIATTRYLIVDLETSAVTRYAQSFQAYTPESYDHLLESCGFEPVARYPALTGVEDPGQSALCVLVARKPQFL